MSASIEKVGPGGTRVPRNTGSPDNTPRRRTMTSRGGRLPCERIDDGEACEELKVRFTEFPSRISDSIHHPRRREMDLATKRPGDGRLRAEHLGRASVDDEEERPVEQLCIQQTHGLRPQIQWLTTRYPFARKFRPSLRWRCSAFSTLSQTSMTHARANGSLRRASAQRPAANNRSASVRDAVLQRSFMPDRKSAGDVDARDAFDALNARLAN